MKFIRGLIILILLSFPAYAFAAAPYPGVYERRNSDGTLARLTVIVSSGNSSSGWGAPDTSPLIILQGYENGREVIEIAARYTENNDGTAGCGLVYEENELARLLDYGDAVAQRYPDWESLGNIKRDNGKVIFNRSAKLKAKKSKILEGAYTPVNSIPKLTVPLVQFVAEQGLYRDIYYPAERGSSRPEIFGAATKICCPPGFTAAAIRGNSIGNKACFISNDYSLIMVENLDKRTFDFPYAGEKFPQSTEYIWRDFNGCGDIETNAVYLCRYLWQTRETFRQPFSDGLIHLILADFYYGGNGIVTSEFRVWKKNTDKPGYRQLDYVQVVNNGEIKSVD